MAISFVAAGSFADGTSATLTPGLPAGLQEGDLLLAVLFSRGEGGNSSGTVSSVSFSPPSGWTKLPGDGTSFRHANNLNDLTLEVWYKFAGSSESAPEIGCNTVDQGWCCALAAYRGVDESDLTDVDAVAANSGTAADFTPADVTTLSADSWVISVCAINNDGALVLGTDRGFSLRFGGAAYDSSQGADMGIGLADLLVETPGSTPLPTWDQSVGGDPSWVTLSFALKQASSEPQVEDLLQALESSSAQAFGRRKIKLLGQATEGALAQAIARKKLRIVQQASQSAAASSKGKQKTKAFAQGLEQDVSQSLDRLKVLLLGQATSATLAQPFTVEGPDVVPLGQALETSTGRAFGKVKLKAFGQAVDSSVAGTFTWKPIRLLRAVVETSTAQPMGATKHYGLGVAVALQPAMAVAPAKRRTLGSPTADEQATAFGKSKAKVLPQAEELDAAQVVLPVKRLALGQALESSTATPVGKTKVRLVGQADEFDFARDLFVNGIIPQAPYVIDLTTGQLLWKVGQKFVIPV